MTVPVADIHLDIEYAKLVAQLGTYLKNDILTPEALKCTEQVIAMNEGHYTAWSFRRKVLFALKAHLNEELDFIHSFTAETPKNYQLWQHRQVIMERISSPASAAEDLQFSRQVLQEDAKNIHCWQYRVWLIEFFGLNECVGSEFEFVDELLAEDVYNNSAWNFRSFLQKYQKKLSADSAELNWCLSKLTPSTQDNECFWNYLAHLIDPKSDRNQIMERLEGIIGGLEDSSNWLYWRFALITSDSAELTNTPVSD